MLQIINFTYRDYVRTWYQRRISDDEEFHYDIRRTVQRVIVAFSERYGIHFAVYKLNIWLTGLEKSVSFITEICY